MKLKKSKLVEIINEELEKIHKRAGLTSKEKSDRKEKFLGMVTNTEKVNPYSGDDEEVTTLKSGSEFAAALDKVDSADDDDLAENIVEGILDIFKDAIKEQS